MSRQIVRYMPFSLPTITFFIMTAASFDQKLTYSFYLKFYVGACQVLLWLKQWDSCVFGSEIKTTTEDVLSSLRRHTSVAQHQKSNKSYIGKNKEPWQNRETFREYKMLDQENKESKGSQDFLNRNRKSTPEQKVSHTI